MSFIHHFKRVQFIDYLVKKKATGDLETFAKKNRLSKRGLTNVLKEMREMGFPIKFSRSLNSYYYTEEGGLVKNLFVFKKEDILSREELRLMKTTSENLCFSETTVFEICDV